MSTLKEVTWDYHKLAERQEFVKVLLSGKINPEFYAVYLHNQYLKYSILEDNVRDSIPRSTNLLAKISRSNLILQDFMEVLTEKETPPPILPSTDEFIQRVVSIVHEKKKPDLLLGYLYTLHMGDLSGGQMIAKKIPGTGRMYEFAEDVESLKDSIREMISRKEHLIADEAIFCFENSTKLFQELMELDIEHYLESSD